MIFDMKNMIAMESTSAGKAPYAPYLMVGAPLIKLKVALGMADTVDTIPNKGPCRKELMLFSLIDKLWILGLIVVSPSSYVLCSAICSMFGKCVSPSTVCNAIMSLFERSYTACCKACSGLYSIVQELM